MPEPGASKPHFRTIALIVGAAMFMEQLDGTVLATALPSMARELGVSHRHVYRYLAALNEAHVAMPPARDGWGRPMGK